MPDFKTLQPIPVVKDKDAGAFRTKVRSLELVVVAERGSPNQVERYHAGLLPEDELLAMARAELFLPLERLATDGLRKWSTSAKLKPADVRHVPGCGLWAVIDFETTAPGEMNHDEWELFKKVTRAASEVQQHPWLDAGAVNVTPVQHWATCRQCKAEAAKVAVKVAISWAGRVLVREYLVTQG